MAITRQDANKKIVKIISDYVERYPDLRFHQILQILCIVKPGKDQFYEESVQTLDKVQFRNSID